MCTPSSARTNARDSWGLLITQHDDDREIPWKRSTGWRSTPDPAFLFPSGPPLPAKEVRYSDFKLTSCMYDWVQSACLNPVEHCVFQVSTGSPVAG